MQDIRSFFFTKNDTLSRNTGVILYFFEAKFMQFFVKYYLGVSETILQTFYVGFCSFYFKGQ